MSTGCYDLQTAYGLYRDFLAPLAPAWKPAKRLVVVSDGLLGTIPLAILVTEPTSMPKQDDVLFSQYRDVPWLARSHAIAHLPSVASLAALRATASASAAELAFVGFGDPLFDRSATPVAQSAARGQVRGLGTNDQTLVIRSTPRTGAMRSATSKDLPRLPDTADEIVAVASALGANLDRDVFLGVRATETNVMELNDTGVLKRYRVLSFATHGLVAGDLDGLDKPALALSEPSPQEAAAGADGLLTTDEILGLDLDADWVVLSACNTAAGDGSGAEAVSGLGRAFFYAGADALLVSNWPVHSEATRSLMTYLFKTYSAQSSGDRAQALRSALVYMIDEEGFRDDQGRMVFSYAHPLFWAPFTLVGDGGGAQVGS